MRNLNFQRIQCDEIWSSCGAKEKNASPEKKRQGWGDVWTWTALCPDTKLIPCWFVGDRSAASAYHFIHDLEGRLASRVQLTTDGHSAYVNAVESAFGSEIDYRRERRRGPLQSGAVHGRTQDMDFWKAGSATRFHQPHGTAKSFDAYGNAAIHAINERFFQEAGKSRTSGCPLFHVLQFRPHSSDVAGDTGDGGRNFKPRLDTRRNCRITLIYVCYTICGVRESGCGIRKSGRSPTKFSVR